MTIKPPKRFAVMFALYQHKYKKKKTDHTLKLVIFTGVSALYIYVNVSSRYAFTKNKAKHVGDKHNFTFRV